MKYEYKRISLTTDYGPGLVLRLKQGGWMVLEETEESVQLIREMEASHDGLKPSDTVGDPDPVTVSPR